MKNKSIIVPGRLYEWRGNIVRAGRPTNNGLRHVRIHNVLNGFVADKELDIVSKNAVKQYLALANHT